MPAELAKDAWRLSALAAQELGPYGGFPRLSDEAKAEVWAVYGAGRPRRVPVTLGTNNRVFLLDPRFDAEGLDYALAFRAPEAMVLAQLRWQYVCRCRYHVLSDHPTELPESWEISADTQNVYEAAFFGAPIHFHATGQPETTPILTDDNKRSVFDADIDRPLARGFFKDVIDLCERMGAFVAGKTFFGCPITIVPYTALGTDGPLTVAMNLRGPAILTDLKRDPAYAHQLFDFLVAAAVKRHHAFLAHGNLPPPPEVWMADDSIALLSPAQYREFLLPQHRAWYAGVDPHADRKRGMHLCGDATRHFAALRDECGVTSFDTGFPVDFAALRRELGPEVEIAGGVDVPTLLVGTPEEVYARAREILRSGVRAGGRFIFREGNNLPPRIPWANLAAMYQAAFDFGLHMDG